MFKKLELRISDTNTVCMYTDMECAPGDAVVIETKFGTTRAHVLGELYEIGHDPFESGIAKCRVLENITKKNYLPNKEELIMFANQKTVEVRQAQTGKKVVVYTDLDLKVGDIVVYVTSNAAYVGNKVNRSIADEIGGVSNNEPELNTGSWSIGVVIDIEPDCITARTWVVDKIDTVAYEERRVRSKELLKIKAKLDLKKKQFQDMELIRLIAQSDPETAALLETYNSVLKGDK